MTESRCDAPGITFAPLPRVFPLRVCPVLLAPRSGRSLVGWEASRPSGSIESRARVSLEQAPLCVKYQRTARVAGPRYSHLAHGPSLLSYATREPLEQHRGRPSSVRRLVAAAECGPNQGSFACCPKESKSSHDLPRPLFRLAEGTMSPTASPGGSSRPTASVVARHTPCSRSADQRRPSSTARDHMPGSPRPRELVRAFQAADHRRADAVLPLLESADHRT